MSVFADSCLLYHKCFGVTTEHFVRCSLAVMCDVTLRGPRQDVMLHYHHCDVMLRT